MQPSTVDKVHRSSYDRFQGLLESDPLQEGMGPDPCDHQVHVTPLDGFPASHRPEDPNFVRTELPGNAKDLGAVGGKNLAYAEPLSLSYGVNLGNVIQARFTTGAHGGHSASHPPCIDTAIAVPHSHLPFHENCTGTGNLRNLLILIGGTISALTSA